MPASHAAHSHDMLPTPGFPLREHVLLAPYTSFGIGGPARWFASIHTEQELAAACAWARESRLPVFVLGGGSNVLIADSGFPGLVLHMALLGMEQQASTFTAAAGEDWNALVTLSVQANCAGMECLAGIPGTVGGTPVQNVGAYGQEVSQTITEVRCYDTATTQFIRFQNADCGFAYRTSRFNTALDQGRYIVTQVTYALEPSGAPLLTYADLRQHFNQHSPTLAEVAEAVRAIRRRKGMVLGAGSLPQRDPDTRSAGSFFRNPVISDELFSRIASSVAPQTPPSYPAEGAPGCRKLPAAWLVEQAGFPKGFALAGAALSSKHTLALTNASGSATAVEVLALRDTIVEGVWQRFGVRLQQEPVLVGLQHSQSPAS